MPAAIRTAGHNYVIEVSCLRLQDANLAGGENRIDVVAEGVGNDWTGDVVKCGLSGPRPSASDCIAHPRPRETVIIGALHTDDR